MSEVLLQPFFDPRSVAIIGASRDPSKVGGSVLANLRAAGFEGRVIPVNASAETVQGLAAVPSILAVEGPVDLAVIAVPAPAVLPAIEECARKGVGGAVVISAGFREIGAEGRERERKLREWLAHRPLRVLGPNCLGWIRPSKRLNVTFAPGMPLPGGIAFISHSGALAVAILDWARDRRMGFSLFASLGNQADLTESDVLEAAAHDPETRVIVGYIEGLADGRRFFRALREAAALKPVVLLKAGRSAAGARAVSSHTGALAGSDAAFDAAVKQAGAVTAPSVEGLFDLARGLATQPLPRGRRLLVLTNGGGLGIVATDAAGEAGLEVVPLDEGARERLRAVLPPTASVGNPVDIVGDADAARYGNALRAAGPESADAAVVVLTAQATTESLGVARAIVGATRSWPIPVMASFVGGARVAAGARAVEEAGIPCYAFPEHAVAALGRMALLASRRSRARGEARRADPPAGLASLLTALESRGGKMLGMGELGPLLDAYGIPMARAELASSVEEAAEAAVRIGFPVAVKIASPDITHKTDVGGVRLGCRSREEVAEAAGAMLRAVRDAQPSAAVDGFLVQRMLRPGHELLLGMICDEQFGPLVMVGFGGIYVEVLKDTAARLAPVSPGEALEMLAELRMAPVLGGIRGRPAANRQALADMVSRFSRLAVDVPGLLELELNPVVADEEGATAVDARGMVAQRT